MKSNHFTNCPVCNNNDIGYLKNFEKLHLMKCNNCTFVFDERIPSEFELNEHYKVYAYSGLKPISEQTVKSYNRLLDQFEKYRESGNILDLGCGQGDFLIEAKKRNWNVYGVEYSESAVNLCKSRGIEMHQGSLTEDVFGDMQFDVITSFEVIEHINNPNDFMSAATHKLKEKGLFYCTTPNFNSILRFFEKDKFKMICYPEHISFYTKKSIKYLGNKHHLKSVKIETTGLDIGRLLNVIKSSKNHNTPENTRIEAKAVNENIRDLSGSNPYVGLLKNVVNYLLSMGGRGDTLKVIWIK